MIPALVTNGTGAGPAARTSERRQKYGKKIDKSDWLTAKSQPLCECAGLPCTSRSRPHQFMPSGGSWIRHEIWPGAL